jgi:hypothetical protein
VEVLVIRPPIKSLQLTANPVRSLFAAELGRYCNSIYLQHISTFGSLKNLRYSILITSAKN